VSPEGHRLVYGLHSGWHQSYYVYDSLRGARPLNTGGYYDEWPIWSPDGKFIVLTSDRDGPRNLYRLPADGSGGPERLVPSDEVQQPSSWSSEGVIAYLQGGDIWVLPPGGDPAPFFPSPEEEMYPAFSPDGHWIAYTSQEVGSVDRGVYVRPYPGPGLPTRVSVGHVHSPAWSNGGDSIYYLEGTGDRHRMMVVDVTSLDPFRVGSPTPLIDPWPYSVMGPVRGYDILPNGSFVAVLDQGFQVLREEAVAVGVDEIMWREKVGELHVILNFEGFRGRGGG
jgi:Tol biopolymer transport system component